MDLLEKNASHDDEIIDLTDIIEQGAPAPSAKPNAEQNMDAQMDTLFTKGNKEDQHLVPEAMDDIDSLLAEMSESFSASEPAAQASHAAPAAPALNPDETLDMPNMSEVDALLQDLDIPPQPMGKTAASIPDNLEDDIDSMLGDLLDGSPKAEPKAAPAPTMDMDDLDALLGTVPVKDKPKDEPKAEPKTAPATVMDMDDLDALLGTVPVKDKPKDEPKAEPKAAPAPTLDDDLDALLGAKPTSPAEEPSFDDELEALLAAAAAPSPAPKGGHRVAPEPPMTEPASKVEEDPADIPSLEDDLDALFKEVSSNTGPIDVDSAPPFPSEEDDDTPIDVSDLDDSALDDSPAPADTEDLAKQAFEEISTLMADVTPAHEVLTTPPAVDVAMVSMDDMADMPRHHPKDEEDLPELDALDALLHAASATDAADPQAAPSANLELATDASLALDDDDTTFTDEEIAQAAQELYDEKIMAEATTGDVDTSAWLNSLDEVLDDTDDGDTSTQDTVTPAPKANATESAPMTESIDQLLAHLPDDPENSHYIYRPSAADAKLDSVTTANRQVGDQVAADENPQFEKAYEHELARLQHITDRFTQSLAAADMHIAALTNTTSSAVPPIRSMDDMLRADGPFTSALQSLVRSAVASELNPAAPPIVTQSSTTTGDNPAADNSLTASGISGLDQRLDGLSANLQNLQERITALEDGNKEARLQTVEARVDGQVKTIIHLEERCKILEAHLEAQAKSQADLENRFQHEVERAAAAAAAKIIREEIAGILAGQ